MIQSTYLSVDTCCTLFHLRQAQSHHTYFPTSSIGACSRNFDDRQQLVKLLQIILKMSDLLKSAANIRLTASLAWPVTKPRRKWHPKFSRDFDRLCGLDIGPPGSWGFRSRQKIQSWIDRNRKKPGHKVLHKEYKRRQVWQLCRPSWKTRYQALSKDKCKLFISCRPAEYCH